MLDDRSALTEAVGHYLERIAHLLALLSRDPEADARLEARLAPDMFDAGFNLALAIQFAARALCPPAGLSVPEIPERFTCGTLTLYRDEVAAHIAPIQAQDLREAVTHRAGEAELTQAPETYIATFALPNMIFHLTIAYAVLRQGGLALGKADFDGLHCY